jgi:hypothetical protein
MSDEPITLTPVPRCRWLWPTILVLLLVLTTVAGFFVWAGVRSLGAEENLQATRFAVRLVEKFVRERGRWPASWQELEAVSGDEGPFRTGDMVGYQWPGDWPAALPRLREHVVIDFQVDAASLARQDRMVFHAIRPAGPAYEYRDYGEVDLLLRSLRSRLKSSE